LTDLSRGSTFRRGAPFPDRPAAAHIPIRIGDDIELRGDRGVVEDIHLIYTVLRLTDGKRLIIPNDTLGNEVIKNLTMGGATRVARVEVLVPLAGNPDLVRKALLAVANGAGSRGAGRAPREPVKPDYFAGAGAAVSVLVSAAFLPFFFFIFFFSAFAGLASAGLSSAQAWAEARNANAESASRNFFIGAPRKIAGEMPAREHRVV
jgi:hypothetical protein